MPRSVLITGITGFIGSHVAERLVAAGDDVHGFAMEPSPHANLATVADRVRIHIGDLSDLDALRAALAQSSADVVIHLAGQAVPTLASHDPVGTVRVNVVGTATLLAAVAERPGTRLVVASSADVYGAPERVPVDEDAPLRPGNVYAATKAAIEPLVRELGARGTNPATILRPTNTNGPRQRPEYAAASFAKQIAEAEAGAGEPVIRHGRLDAKRDFIDVRDVAAAYEAATKLDGGATYNVGSGVAVALADVLEILVGLARVPVRTELDPSRVRGGPATMLALDASRFRARTGWRPTISLERSLSDTLDHWRAAVAAAPQAVRS